jgi:hypothetical protein
MLVSCRNGYGPTLPLPTSLFVYPAFPPPQPSPSTLPLNPHPPPFPPPHLIKSYECHEQSDVSLCHLVTCNVPLTGQDLFTTVQPLEHIPGQQAGQFGWNGVSSISTWRPRDYQRTLTYIHCVITRPNYSNQQGKHTQLKTRQQRQLRIWEEIILAL